MSEPEMNEELIEQAKIIADKYAIAILKFEDKVDEEMMATIRAEAHIDRRGIIALAEFFLSAVRDGKQKIPGEVGRGGLWSYNKLRYPQDDGSIAQYVDGHLYEGRTDFGYPRHFNFIALRQEEEK